MEYQCQHCRIRYACRHKALEHGDGTFWWKCPTGKKRRLPKAIG